MVIEFFLPGVKQWLKRLMEQRASKKIHKLNLSKLWFLTLGLDDENNFLLLRLLQMNSTHNILKKDLCLVYALF